MGSLEILFFKAIPKQKQTRLKHKFEVNVEVVKLDFGLLGNFKVVESEQLHRILSLKLIGFYLDRA